VIVGSNFINFRTVDCDHSVVMAMVHSSHTHDHSVSSDDHVERLDFSIAEGDGGGIEIDRLRSGETDELGSWAFTSLLQGAIKQHFVHILTVAFRCQLETRAYDGPAHNM
jgi:hypothetical protein